MEENLFPRCTGHVHNLLHAGIQVVIRCLDGFGSRNFTDKNQNTISVTKLVRTSSWPLGVVSSSPVTVFSNHLE